IHRKITWANPYRHAAAAQQTILERLNHVDVKRIALHIGPAGFEDHLLAAAIARRMSSHTVAAQLPVDVAQRKMADPAHALGRQIEAFALLENVTALFEQRLHAHHAFEVLLGIAAEKFFQKL